MGPATILRYGPLRGDALQVAFVVCRDHGWLLPSSEPSGGLLVVTERSVGQLLRRLGELGAAPDAVIVRSRDLLPAQVRALREALPPGTILEVVH